MLPSITLPELILELYDVGGLKFGSFTVRTGEVTPVYIDMRVIWSYPKLVKAVTEHIYELMKEKSTEYDHICGLPYQGIPIASVISTQHNVPMLLKRQKPKEYGTCKAMEGHYKEGQTVIVVDDILMTGGTLFEDIPFFNNAGLKVSGAVVFCDRDQGGKERIEHIHNVQIHSVVTLPQVLNILVPAGKISQETADNTLSYLKANRFDTEEYDVIKAENMLYQVGSSKGHDHG